MDREANQEKPSLLSTATSNNIEDDHDHDHDQQHHHHHHHSPKKPQVVSSERLKRDEWSEGAVSSLLEAYEAKWILRNRAKLKGQDWEDVAKHVSGRSNSTKSPKTQTQCKNKIESMKKRYRSESATPDASSWPLFPRLDLLLRGNAPPPLPPLPPPLPPLPVVSNPHFILMEQPLQQSLHPPPPPPALPHDANVQENSHGSNGPEPVAKKEGGGPRILSDQESDKNALMETDSSTPAVYTEKEKLKSKSVKMRVEKKKQKRENCGIAESIRMLGEMIVRSEQARMETMRELERMRAETEAKRGEMELKRTEIIANTQLEIAKLFAAAIGKEGVDSSLRIGRS